MSLLQIKSLAKSYDNGFQALKSVDLEVREGEILALLGPNGAGKTSLISATCGLTKITSGTITVGGYDVVRQPMQARRQISLVPQEITLEPFEKVITTVRLSRGLFGLPPDEAHIEKVLRRLSLWDKKDTRNMALSGGMKRRVMIAKALSHSPKLLFLDEPSAGVDVELRNDMWRLVEELKAEGVTIILTTHYIEEAEEVADRVAIINHGDILLVEEKTELMKRLGKKELMIELHEMVSAIPQTLRDYDLRLSEDGYQLIYTYDAKQERTGITTLLTKIGEAGLRLKDLQTHTSSLEEIFVSLVHEDTQS
ncbi:MAG: ABC transporter ATP-binding protein [Candidatus Puniceispirillaceae bacterium]